MERYVIVVIDRLKKHGVIFYDLQFGNNERVTAIHKQDIQSAGFRKPLMTHIPQTFLKQINMLANQVFKLLLGNVNVRIFRHSCLRPNVRVGHARRLALIRVAAR